MTDWNQIITIVGSILGGGTITAFFGWLSNRRNNAATGRSVEIKGELQIVDSAITLVATLREDLKRLSERIEHVENRNRNLESTIEGLENENVALEKKVLSLTHQNDELRRRCDALEEANAQLRPRD
jgi:predicted RNase H-like nuclease (RuvC/YqgF family)